nr:YopX family protein [uncultured Leptotrichia sp.]
MREIKFRAWLKEDKRMVNVETMDFTDKSIQYLKKSEINNAYILRRESFVDVELMQYTGVKDKNGKEIYEGDIIKYKFPYDRRLNHISPVKFLETETSFGIKDRYGIEIPLYKITTNNFFEVIGNIYENKNLLEENK